MIRLDNFSFSYGPRPLFDNLTLEFARPIEVIVGPSGCGKSTLLKLVTGILKPDAGQVVPAGLRSLLVLQEDSLFPWLSGMENISVMFPGATDFLAKIQQHPAYDLVEPFIGEKAWRMSFGQRRSVELFRALLAEVELLCLDEPFNFLDAERRQRFLGLFLDSAQRRPILLCTHEVSELPLPLQTAFVFEGPAPFSDLPYKPVPKALAHA
jgi:NitT/TauT family transport system ATP-binding protein